ncbi:MAG: N-formylglutamate amidohydrolase [Opitutales bacterium]
MQAEFSYLVTCEHASKKIPAPWRSLLEPYLQTLPEHRAWDPGTREIGRELGQLLRAPVFEGEVTRLLVELNRSVTHRELFSPPVAALPPREKTKILCDYYYPYRHQVMQQIETYLQQDLPIIHISVHSFSPVFDDKPRHTDFGLLFDPWRKGEKQLAEGWLHFLRQQDRRITCHPNSPYLGISDGHVPLLRRMLPPRKYYGFELEFNQKFPLAEHAPSFARWIDTSLRYALNNKSITSFLRPAPVP